MLYQLFLQPLSLSIAVTLFAVAAHLRILQLVKPDVFTPYTPSFVKLQCVVIFRQLRVRDKLDNPRA